MTHDLNFFSGADAAPTRVPDLLVECPHGATRASDYSAVLEQLVGDLPPDLEHFFHVNTDEGSFELAHAIAEAVVMTRPAWRVLVIRCLIPRTFIDTNRLADASGGDLQTGAMTPALQPYVRNRADREYLRSLHAAYQQQCDRWYATVCGAGGLALIPHTYAPRSVGIARIDDRIVEELHRVYAPTLVDTWPLRPEVDLITRDPSGTRVCADIANRVAEDLIRDGVQVVDGDTYHLHPSTMGAVRAADWPGQTLCWEVRRDLLGDPWVPFGESTIDTARIARIARPFADAARDWLDRRPHR